MKRPKNNKSVIYVNFTPYENAGHILDYLLRNFHTVLLFSFQFHKISENRNSDMFIIFQNGKIVRRYKLFHAPVTSVLTFFLLPVRSAIIFLQIVIYVLLVRKTYGPYDLYFTVNAFTAWIGNVLNRLNIVDKTIFWVWDYYPMTHKLRIVVLMRWLYWQFDKLATKNTQVVYLTHKIFRLHRKIESLSSTKKYPIVGIGTAPLFFTVHKPKNQISLAFLGTIKKTQGLDMIFDNEKMLLSHFPDISIHIFGGGPDEKYFRQKAAHSKIQTKFYGYVPDSTKLLKLISRCSIGIATYKPDPDNVSFYGDPSKIKAYLSSSLPVITTNVFEFHKEITSQGAGCVIHYDDGNDLVNAIRKIMDNYTQFSRNARRLSKKYEYSKLYRKLFDVPTEE